MKSHIILDVKKGLIDKTMVILAEFDSYEDAVSWQSKLKGDYLQIIVDYPIMTLNDYENIKWNLVLKN
jgi:hypothetical protein